MYKTYAQPLLEECMARTYRKMFLRQWARKFGARSEDVKQRLENGPADQLEGLSEALMTTDSRKELGLED